MAHVNNSTLKALEVLEMLAEAEDGARLTDIAEESGYPLSTARRLLMSLIERGYVEQDPQTSRYHLGAKILTLQAQGIRHRHVGRLAYSHLSLLRQQLDETINMGILSERSVIYLETLAPDSSFSFYAPPGTRMPLHATAMGKVLLAHLPTTTRAAMLATLEWKPFTPHTITSSTGLEAALTTIARQGYAVDNEEYALGIRCIAAPIADYSGRVVAGVSVTALATRLPSEREMAVAGTLKLACAHISQSLGFRVSGPGAAG